MTGDTYKFADATEEDLRFLILWMETNHDAIGSYISEDIETWIEGTPVYVPADLPDFLQHFEWHIEVGRG